MLSILFQRLEKCVVAKEELEHDLYTKVSEDFTISNLPLLLH